MLEWLAKWRFCSDRSGLGKWRFSSGSPDSENGDFPQTQLTRKLENFLKQSGTAWDLGGRLNWKLSISRPPNSILKWTWPKFVSDSQIGEFAQTDGWLGKGDLFLKHSWLANWRICSNSADSENGDFLQTMWWLGTPTPRSSEWVGFLKQVWDTCV